MELPKRSPGDQYTPSGHYGELQTRIRSRLGDQRIPTLFVYCFDYRTRVGPFLFIDKVLIPGAPQAVGAALHAAGIHPLRLVLQQWTPHVRPSRARLDGEIPELLLVSSMQIHSAAAYELIRDAWSLGEDRPLILAGGPKGIYEPWDFFGLSADGNIGADVVITGEEFVLLELLDCLLEHRLPGETLRRAFERARRAGALERIPGLVFRPDDGDGFPKYLINTGIQRLVRNLDELPLPFDALGLYEPSHRRPTLSPRAIRADRLGWTAKVIPINITHGCKFRCTYCPIPAYNQFTFRSKSPERLAEEMAGVVERSRIEQFFSTDDNFFNNRPTIEELFTVLARSKVGKRPFRDAVQFATEATEFDVFRNRDLLPLARDAGLRLIWFGIEDLTAELVKKGQAPQKTTELFRLLVAQGIGPMPMLMHHDGQPLWTRDSLYGLLNQVRYLRKAGALSVQVTMLTPMIGTKGYEDPYRQGLVMDRVGREWVDDHLYDGNHCIATADPAPLRKQLNILAAYAYFYNPWHFFVGLFRFDRVWFYRVFWQMLGNAGLLKTIFSQLSWIGKLIRGPITKRSAPPAAKCRMVVPEHADPQLAHYGLGVHLPLLDAEGPAEGCRAVAEEVPAG